MASVAGCAVALDLPCVELLTPLTRPWGGGGAHHALCRRCAKSGPIFPDGQGERSNYRVPMHKTTQILTQSKISDNELQQTILPTKNTKLLSKSAVFALWTYLTLWWVVIRVVTGKLTYY